MKRIRPKNWAEFQHYKDRSPLWIKLHKRLLDDFEFQCLPLASKALAPMLWLLASEYPNGDIPSETRKIAFRLRMTLEELSLGFEPLVRHGFFEIIGENDSIDDSTAREPLASCYQDASPEKENKKQVTSNNGETEVESEARVARTRQKSPRSSVPAGFPGPCERQWAEEFWTVRHRPDLVARYEDIAAQFVDHHAKNATLAADWPAAWRTWARRAPEFERQLQNQRISAHDKGSLGAAMAIEEYERRNGIPRNGDGTGTPRDPLSANGHGRAEVENPVRNILGRLQGLDAGSDATGLPALSPKR